jgi:hypothetical protein
MEKGKDTAERRPLWREWLRKNRKPDKLPGTYKIEFVDSDFQTYLEQEIITLRERVNKLDVILEEMHGRELEDLM